MNIKSKLIRTFSIKKFIVALAVIFLANIAGAQGDYYGIYYPAYTNVVVNNSQGTNWWINAVKNNWAATGVQLEVHLRSITPNSLNPSGTTNHTNVQYDWTELDNAIDIIIANGMDLNIRLRLGSLLPDWADFQCATADECGYAHYGSGYYSKSDFHYNCNNEHMYPKNTDGTPVVCPSRNANRFFNYTSSRAIGFYTTIFSAVVEHVTDYALSHGYNFAVRRPIEFTPTANISGGELEYSSDDQMTGYSPDEIAGFRTFLVAKYSTIANLNAAWGSSMTSFNDVSPGNPGSYNWEAAQYPRYGQPGRLFDDYTYPAGRVDWLEFKSQGLKEMIDRLADIVKTKMENTANTHLAFGVQLGALHDSHVEFRGFYDPTSFLEKAAAFRLADIIGMEDTFAFSSDYARSMGKYWEALDGVHRGFSSETNNHAFGWDGTGDVADYVTGTLVPSWIIQVTSYHDRGSDCHIVNFWGNLDDGSAYRVIDPTFYDSQTGMYRNYIALLNTLKYTTLVTVNNNKVVHLSAACAPFRPIITMDPEKRFYLAYSTKERTGFTTPLLNYQDTGFDIVTDYMIQHSPYYLNKYSNLYLTIGSQYMSDATYNSLMQTIISVPVANVTGILDNGHAEFYTTPGLYDKYGETRCPIHLVWRSRHDLMDTFPTGNMARVGNPAGWPANDPQYDLLYWAKIYATGYNNASLREYPGLEVYDPNSTPAYYYDENIAAVWSDRSDLQTVFPNGHYNSAMTSSMISWASTYGYLERAPLKNYNNWPYIGTHELLGQWDFNDGSGTELSDSSDNQMPGTLIGSPTWVSDGRGGGTGNMALSFSGNGGYVTFGKRDILNMNNYTVMGWIKPTTSGVAGRHIIERYDGNGGFLVQLYSDNRIYVYQTVNNSLYTIYRSAAFPTSDYHHFAMVFSYDGTTSSLKLYIDGAQAGTTGTAPYAPDFPAEMAELVMAKPGTPSTSVFQGQLDGFKIYGKALGDADILAEYNKTAN